jgi:hypothetical protein
VYRSIKNLQRITSISWVGYGEGKDKYAHAILISFANNYDIARIVVSRSLGDDVGK